MHAARHPHRLSIFLIGLLAFLPGATSAHFLPLEGRLTLGFERPGVSVVVGYHADGRISIPLEASQVLWLNTSQKKFVLKGLNDLRGSVQIRNTEEALRFVRLRTSPETWYLWNDGQESQFEIIEASELVNLPAFGLSDHPFSVNTSTHPYTYWTLNAKTGMMELTKVTLLSNGGATSKILKTEKHPDLSLFGDGHNAILTREAFRAGGFAPPVMKQAANGFEIVRWVYIEFSANSSRSGRVAQIREIVGKDGSYKRQVLQNKKPPKLPNTSWFINRPE